MASKTDQERQTVRNYHLSSTDIQSTNSNATKMDNNYSEAGNISSMVTQTNTIFPVALNVFFASLNFCLSIGASLGNALILIVLHKVYSVHAPTKLLFRCLAVTDLLAGVITQLLFATLLLLNAYVKMNMKILNCLRKVENISSFSLCGSSILLSTAISVDRLLAFKLGLRYRHVVTLRRVRAVVTCVWLTGGLGGLYFSYSYLNALTVAIVFILLSVFTSIFSYTKIFLTLRQHQVQVHDQISQGQQHREGSSLNITRYKNTVSSIAWVQLALVVCYVPFIVSVVTADLFAWKGMTAHIFSRSATTLLYLNSSLNPILYCWRIKEVRQALKETVNQLLC